MIAYRYDPEQGNKYAGEQTCQRDPVASERAGKDVYLLPGNCTYIAPPEKKEGFDIVWNDKNESWGYQEHKDDTPKKLKPYVPTLEDKINALDNQYQYEKQTLMGYYVEFMLAGDTDSMEEIKAELVTLAEQYDADLAALKGGEE